MPTQSRDEALDILEKARHKYIETARSVARMLHHTSGEPITVDDIRSVCPPPAEIDGRVMGAILREPEWVRIGYLNSARKTCHGRPISAFVRTIKLSAAQGAQDKL